MVIPVLWPGVVSRRVGASSWANLLVPFPPWTENSQKNQCYVTLDFDHSQTCLIANGTWPREVLFQSFNLLRNEWHYSQSSGHLCIKSHERDFACRFSFNLQRVYVATSRQLKRIESVSRSPIFNNFFETINGASTIRAFDQQQRLIRDNYYRVDENNVAFYPGTSANRCVVNTILFIPEAYLVHSDRNDCQMWLYYCFLLWILGKCSCCWISTWSLKVLVKGENAKRSQKLKHTLRHSGKSLRQVVSGPGLTTRKEFENVVLASQTHQMFSVHTTTEKFKNASITGHLVWFFVGGKFGHRDHVITLTPSFFPKAPLSKCFPSTRKRKAGFSNLLVWRAFS